MFQRIALVVWPESDIALILVLIVIILGAVVFLIGVQERRQSQQGEAGSTPDPLPGVSQITLVATLNRVSRAVNLALIFAALALVGSATVVGLRVADSHEVSNNGETVASPTVSVVGQGRAPLEPDTAALVIGVENTWRTIGEATQSVDAAIAAAIDAGADPETIQTVAYRVVPVQTPASEGVPSQMQGVQVNYRVSLFVRDLTLLDTVLGAVTDAGATVFGVGVGVNDPSAAVNQARARAVADARARVDEIVMALGTTTLHMDIAVETVSSLPPSPLAIAVSDPASPPPPATAEVSVEVHLTYAVQ